MFINVKCFSVHCRCVPQYGKKMFKFMNKIMRKTDLIINLISNSESVINNRNETNSSLLPDFPLSTMEEFEKFEADMAKDRKIREQFVSIFFI